MKQLFLVAVGCLPLGWLTVSNVLPWQSPVESAVSAGERLKLDLVAIQSRATVAERKAAEELPFVRSLVTIEPFTDTLQTIDATTVPDRYKRVAKSWQDYTRTHAAVGNLAKLYRIKSLPTEEVERLTAYLAGRPLTGLRSGEMMEQWCQQRIATLTEADRTAKALEEIRHLFAREQYDEVLKRLRMLREDVLSATERTEMERLRLKSTFGLHWKGNPDTEPNPRTRVTRLTELLKDSPLPIDEKDRGLLARREQEKADLVRRIRVDDLFDTPPARLLDLAEECGRILDDDPASRVRLQNGWKKWIEARLLIKSPPKYHPDEKEAWEEAGRYRRGVFKPSKFSDPVNGARYLYWANPTTVTSKQFDTEIYLKHLLAEPDEMLEVRLCRQYNEQLAVLLKKTDSQRGWEEFATSCDDMQKQLIDYYTKIQSKQKVVSFQTEGQLAREVVNEWSKVVRILR